MFYSYFNNQARLRPYATGGITYGAAQSTIQAVQQAWQTQQQAQQQAQQQMQQGIQPYYSSMDYCYPMYNITPSGISFSTIAYGTVYNL
ncbi:TPA: DUF3947 family protein [Bacillus paranthracis]|uniref:DUF3947 family protein n=1 Tax=Bacillus paranthracis TaxID=2026186 RepID=UPI00254DA6AC|nr:DUF3947 family protein [Bacillus paranthracis]MDK7423422.1 DUF3947 family protein [Bacillus paranthracis]MDK7451166.1 DUF3947 family protein [Bacillus paranthracis]MDK7463207.1 DUF3947 family protein [Bacillus paranthracis]MDK7532044.1 DUF3947 family protein [Bacillus paranthracis]HDR3660962.1 DUF3947 family protein [Bacillus paranthracis]